MSGILRSTPCVGICSTTYGDLVCRGCKRFSHEIVAWNVYTENQRDRVWARLHSLRDQAAAVFVAVSDEPMLRDAAQAARIELCASASVLTLGYEVLRRRARDLRSLGDIGMIACDARCTDPVAARDAIDAEFHVRSVAYFEHSFHTPAD
jgi:predicted Fe-S protein YdhL (DUF1289 family)